MPIYRTNYTNSAESKFAIEIDRLPVPDNADYWGYELIVKDSSGLQRCFRGMIFKTAAATQALADAFVLTDPFDFLRHSLLDHYDAGATPLYWPNLAQGWAVI
jgi:hypothetical protein